MNPKEAAEALGITRDAVYRALREDRLHGFRYHGHWMIDPAEVRSYRWRRVQDRSTLRTPLVDALIGN